MTEQKALWGWYPAGNTWVKIQVAATGKLVIDPTALFEEPPTNGEIEKAATSNWSFDHNADPDAHHARLHTMSDALDHAGSITDAQHGVRTLINAHAHADLSGVLPDQHHTAFTPADHLAIGDAAPHHPQAHTLASHTTKAHAELTGIGADDHHPQAHTLASHTTKAHAELTGVGANDHHTAFTPADHLAIGDAAPHHVRYADAEAKAACVSDAAYGAGWNGVTDVAPSKNAVYDKIQAFISGNSGTYSGDNTVNRAIPHGLGRSPWMVFIVNNSTAMEHFLLYYGNTAIYKPVISSFLAVTLMNGTNFFVGNATSYANSANATGVTYRWVAI